MGGICFIVESSDPWNNAHSIRCPPAQAETSRQSNISVIAKFVDRNSNRVIGEQTLGLTADD